jgi:dynactin 4
VRYKIKLAAANYLPAINVALPHAQQEQIDAAKRTLGKSTSESDRGVIAPVLHAGKTYPFHLALTNPLYDPIQVRLSVQRVHVSNVTPLKEGGSPEKARRPPFAVSLPTSSFPIAAFAEAWEYEDDEDMFGVEAGDGFGERGGREKDGKGKTKTVGVLEKRANVTVVGGEVVIGKEARGAVKVSNISCCSSTN